MTLSEKIKSTKEVEEANPHRNIKLGWIYDEEVKKAIKELKGLDMGQFILSNGLFSEEMFWEELDKIFGEELLNKEGSGKE